MEKKPTTAIAKKEEVKTTATTKKKGEVKVEQVQPKAEEQKPEQGTPKPEPPKSLNMAYLYSELQAVKQIISEHSQQIADMQEALARKRKPTSNGKIQIRDTKTGKVYPSKNNCYQTMLKAGELKDLVAKGIFGDNPEKNTFGWYALVREYSDRFEEVKEQESENKGS